MKPIKPLRANDKHPHLYMESLEARDLMAAELGFGGTFPNSSTDVPSSPLK